MTEPQSKKSKMTSSLDQLKAVTTVVADTGDFQGNNKKRNEKKTHASPPSVTNILRDSHFFPTVSYISFIFPAQYPLIT